MYSTCGRLSSTEYRFMRTRRDYDWLMEGYIIEYSLESPFDGSREYSVRLSVTDMHSNMVDMLLEASFSKDEKV